GICGGYAHPATRQAVAESDLVLAVGASLSDYTTENQGLVRPERTIHLDLAPGRGRNDFTASVALETDAALGLATILERLGPRPESATTDWDVAGFAHRVRTEP